VRLARGYHGRPELTAERFVPDPFGTEPGARLYRSGDLVRHRPDGTVEFLGRLDTQVKIRGFRIELAEIEAALAKHPAVSAAAVVAKDVGPGDKRLVAYLDWPHDTGPDIDELRAYLRESLPSYMIPSAWVTVAALPLSPSKKVDRAALPDPTPSQFDGARGYVAPRDPAEETIAGIWSDVLGVDRIGVDDDFFGLGGHSLLATRVLARLRAALAVEVPLRCLFEATTVAELAVVVTDLIAAELDQLTDAQLRRRLEGDAAAAPDEGIARVPRETPPALSFAQRRLWILDQIRPGGTEYLLSAGLRLFGPLEPGALRAALDGIVARHEVLRTRYVVVDGEPGQVIDPPEPATLHEVDLRGLDPAAQDERIAGWMTHDRAPVDLATGPVLTGTLARLADQEHALVVTLHHIAFDGWSEQVLWRELDRLYTAALTGGPSPLAPLPVQYADFAAWQRGAMSGATLDRHLDYWRQALAGATAVELPLDRPRPQVRDSACDLVPFAVPAPHARALHELALQAGATPFMVLMAVYAITLGRFGRSDDITVGTPVACRNRAEVQDLIGLFLNTLVLRTDLSGDPSFREVLRRVKEMALGAYAHQELPFERLVDELAPVRDASRTPLFSTMFLWASGDSEGRRVGGLRAEELPVGESDAKFDLTLVVVDQPDGTLTGFLNYATALFDRDTVERFATHFTTLIDNIARTPDAPISWLVESPPAERQMVVRK
jgi:hypothetical protein